jgi:hypothetical protein
MAELSSPLFQRDAGLVGAATASLASPACWVDTGGVWSMSLGGCEWQPTRSDRWALPTGRCLLAKRKITYKMKADPTTMEAAT